MLYTMLPKGNATEWLDKGMINLQASHCNGYTTPPVATWQKTKPKGNLYCCRAITALPYNCRGFTNALYTVKGQCN